MIFYQSGIPNDIMTYKPKHTVWTAEVRAPFKKVIAYDVLFLGLGAIIGAGIITAVLFH